MEKYFFTAQQQIKIRNVMKSTLIVILLLFFHACNGTAWHALRVLIARASNAHKHPTASSELIEQFTQIRTTQLIEVPIMKDIINALDGAETFPDISNNYKTLIHAIAAFNSIPGFALTLQMLFNKLNTPQAKGHIFELENGLRIAQQKPTEAITSFNQTIMFGTIVRSLDIITERRFIECKNICWAKAPANELRKQFMDQKLLAAYVNSLYEVHSKQKPTKAWLDWFKQNNINCFQVS